MKRPKPIARRSSPRRRRKGSKAALARDADRLWSLIVRARGFQDCEAGPGGPLCSGSLQAAHGISRRYRNTRWLPINGFSLCAAHHVYFTHRPLEWDEWLLQQWGKSTYEDLRRLALRTTPPDVEMALEKLRAEAKERGIE